MKIGQLSRAVGCTVETIRFYEQKGLLPKPERTMGGFRLYNNEHLQRLSFICYCRSLDMSLDEIKLLLSLEQQPQEQNQQAIYLLDKHIHDIGKRIHQLQHLRMELVKLREKCGAEASEDFMQLLQSNKIRFRPLK